MSSSDDSSRQTRRTLGAIKERNLALEGYCVTVGCGHFYVFSVGQLIASAGTDYVVPEIAPGIVCTKCGGALEFKLAMIPPKDEDSAGTNIAVPERDASSRTNRCA